MHNSITLTGINNKGKIKIIVIINGRTNGPIKTITTIRHATIPIFAPKNFVPFSISENTISLSSFTSDRICNIKVWIAFF